MKFRELPLYRAIATAHESVDAPRSNVWLITRQRELYMVIVSFMDDFTNGVPFTQADVLTAWERFGKSATVNGVNKCRLTVEVANVHGSTCFYANRGLGECDDEVELERFVPGSLGGVYSVSNCVIACRRHNNERSNTNLQEYLANGQQLQPAIAD
jgi:hypothetical protein